MTVPRIEWFATVWCPYLAAYCPSLHQTCVFKVGYCPQRGENVWKGENVLQRGENVWMGENVRSSLKYYPADGGEKVLEQVRRTRVALCH